MKSVRGFTRTNARFWTPAIAQTRIYVERRRVYKQGATSDSKQSDMRTQYASSKQYQLVGSHDEVAPSSSQFDSDHG